MNLKNSILFFLLGLLYDPAYPKEFKRNTCVKPDFTQEKNLRKVYLQLKYMPKNCLDSRTLLNLSKRSLLAGRFAEALWASQKGLEILNTNGNIVIESELKLIQGSILREMNRLEEAIIVLKNVIREKNTKSSYRYRKNLKLNRQKAFLQLIYTYYNKTGSKRSSDVNYLINSFRNIYPESPYLNLLEDWKNN